MSPCPRLDFALATRISDAGRTPRQSPPALRALAPRARDRTEETGGAPMAGLGHLAQYLLASRAVRITGAGPKNASKSLRPPQWRRAKQSSPGSIGSSRNCAQRLIGWPEPTPRCPRCCDADGGGVEYLRHDLRRVMLQKLEAIAGVVTEAGRSVIRGIERLGGAATAKWVATGPMARTASV
jgi:hypothetical protein